MKEACIHLEILDTFPEEAHQAKSKAQHLRALRPWAEVPRGEAVDPLFLPKVTMSPLIVPGSIDDVLDDLLGDESKCPFPRIP